MAELREGTSLYFSYDANGSVVSVNYNGTEYYYLKNGQGDVVGLIDGNGTRVVNYEYDSWGNPISTTGTMASTLGVDNPLRYRGYYYDGETGLYYLQSRYYDAEVGRFISADAYVSTGQSVLGNNMYAYCGNNPVNRADSDGAAWETVWDLVSLVASIAEVSANPADVWAWVGLAGDVADVLIPFVGGIGETVDAVKFANKASKAKEALQAASQASKATETVSGVKKRLEGRRMCCQLHEGR